MAQVLIVDDDEDFAIGLAEALRVAGHDSRTATTLAEARAAVGSQVPALLLLDLMLPDGSGLELLGEFDNKQPEQILLITGHDAVKNLVSGVVGPRISYLKKPVGPKNVIGLLEQMGGEDEGTREFGLLVGHSAGMTALYKQIRQVAPTDSTVFIQGESGTGKELVAEAIHRVSGRTGPFVPVNCGGLTQELVASELFGHEKGSFTGAGRRHTGYFERAGGGTLFLDEITEMPADMQTQLLRVLETGRFSRVGGESEIETDARLLAATNQDPVQAVKDGKLREDLYFRLNVFPLNLPPLRDRLGDLPALVEFFLSELNRRNSTQRTFAEDALTGLRAHSWPGNVRELKHCVQRMFILTEGSTGQLQAPELSQADLSDDSALPVGQSIREMEKQLILSTLEQLGGDKKVAAEILGISLKTLYNRLNEYGD